MTTRDTSTEIHKHLFKPDGLIQPKRTPAIARALRAWAGRYENPPDYDGFIVKRILWELHRTLYRQPEEVIDLIAEFFMQDEDRRYIPVCSEVRPLLAVCRAMRRDLYHLGIDLEPLYEPRLPPPPRRRPRVLIEDDDE